MKRSEFLKRLGLGAVAAVAAPALLAREETIIDEDVIESVEKVLNKPAPWSITQDFAEKLEVGQTYKYSMTIKSLSKDAVIIDNVSLKQITIPPLDEGEYDYVLESGRQIIAQGKINSI